MPISKVARGFGRENWAITQQQCLFTIPSVAQRQLTSSVSRCNAPQTIPQTSRDVTPPPPRWRPISSDPRLRGLNISPGRAPPQQMSITALRQFLSKDAELEAKSSALLRSISAYDLDILPLHAARSLFKQGGPKHSETGGEDGWVSTTSVHDDELRRWLWILSAETADSGIERLLADDRPKPRLLLTALLSKDRVLKDAGRFIDLLCYIEKHYIDAPQATGPRHAPRLSSMEFLSLLRRLVSHCLRAFPLALPSVANLAVAYISHMPDTVEGSAAAAHAAKCELFNFALETFGQGAARNPFQSMEYNWSAQKNLLNLSSKSHPPLHVSRTGYRAIRRVLAALPKNSSEKEVAKRASKTWPPYRLDFDGRDEQRQPEDDMSRMAKAGVLQREAGYPSDHFDRAMDTLAGSVPGRSPYVQTRTLSPPIWTGRRANSNIGSEWIARVKATRNAREAWREFCHPPSPGVRPWASIYAEMFRKLFAAEADHLSHAVLPGDVKESFPVHNGNLSAVEIARLTPPEPLALYEMMLFSGVRPAGECLIVLVGEAPSADLALRFLEDSDFKDVIPILRGNKHGNTQDVELLSRLPCRLFNAWVKMLCRTHARRPQARDDAPNDTSTHIEDAIGLTTLFYKRGISTLGPERAAWVFILDALASHKVLYSRNGKAASNIPLTLHCFMRIWQDLVEKGGLDDELFTLMCRMVRKTLRLGTYKETRELHLHPPDRLVFDTMADPLFHAYLELQAGFEKLSRPIKGFGSAVDQGEPFLTSHLVSPKLVLEYMRALVVVGDSVGIVGLMRWILDAWDKEYLLRRARDPRELDYEYLMRCLAYFVEAGQRLVEPAVMVELQGQLETLQREKDCSWFWPDVLPHPDHEVQVDLRAARRWSTLGKRLLEAKQDCS